MFVNGAGHPGFESNLIANKFICNTDFHNCINRLPKYTTRDNNQTSCCTILGRPLGQVLTQTHHRSYNQGQDNDDDQ